VAYNRGGTADFATRAVQDVERACDTLFRAALQRFPDLRMDRACAFEGISHHGGIQLIED